MRLRRKACKIKNIRNAKLMRFFYKKRCNNCYIPIIIQENKKSLSHDYTHGMNSRQFQPLKADGSFETIHLL